MGDRGRRFNLGSQTKFWHTSTEAGLEHRKGNREARRKMKAAKEEHREANDVRSNTLKVLSKTPAA